MSIFHKEKGGKDKNLPSSEILHPTLKVLEGFKTDKESFEPVVRLTKQLRQKFGVEKGDYVLLKNGDKFVRARVEVSSVSDGESLICRPNPKARDLLSIRIGDDIEIVPPETIILLMDTSGSMGDYMSGMVKIDAARNAMREFIRGKFLMGHDDKVGVVGFGEFATIIERPTLNYEGLENRLDSLIPNGATALFEGMNLSIDMLSIAGGLKRVVLLTDGIPTTSGRGAIISAAKKAASHHIIIDTVGVGSRFDFIGYDEPLLKKIAAITGGTFRRVFDIQELAEQFRELALEKNYSHLLPEK